MYQAYFSAGVSGFYYVANKFKFCMWNPSLW